MRHQFPPMKKILALVLFASAACFARAAEPVITVDLYGNVFLNGENTNSQIADFARNNPALAPLVDGAVRKAALDARAYIAAKEKAANDAAAAQVAAKDAEKTAALAAAATAAATDKTAAVAAKDAEIAALKATIATAGAHITALQAQVRALGGEPVTAPPSPPAN